MGLLYKARTASLEERWTQIRFEEANGPEKMEMRETFLPPEWFPQSGAQLTWPHAGTDWKEMLSEVTDCYVRMAYEIASREPLLVVTPERGHVEKMLKEKLPSAVFRQIRWADCPTDDTWARDHGFISLMDEKVHGCWTSVSTDGDRNSRPGKTTASTGTWWNNTWWKAPIPTAWTSCSKEEP